jgi:cation:H+ antiporter
MSADIAIVLGGALLILAIAEVVIRLTVRLAGHYRLSGSFVGLTILSVGTSLLEIMTHVVGSVRIVQTPETMNTLSALLLGSNVGSDIFQQNIVLPIAGLIGTVAVTRRLLPVEVGGLIAASTLLWLAGLGGAITRVEGAVLALAYVAYVVYLARHQAPAENPAPARLPHRRAPLYAGLVVLCLIAMALIADPVLGAASRLVARLPISASLFGVVVLGVCAALPELMTALVSIFRGQREISAGILIGSNITNPLFSAGLGAMISGYSVPAVIQVYDLPVKIATGALLYAFLWRRADLSRGEALVLMALYFAYLLIRGYYFPADF